MNLKEKIEELHTKINLAQRKNGLNHQVEIVGVTKTKPFLYIEESYAAGLRHIGENRIQEAESKFGSFNNMPNLKKRFIGHLQSNKSKKCVELFDAVDSISSIKTLKKIKNHSLELNKTMSLFIEINTSKEPQKHGFFPDQKDEILECFDCGGRSIEGLMTIGPNTSENQSIRHAFTTLRETKEWVEFETGRKIKHLSMGMSGDYEIAVEEGSTMIRVGSFLYGPRN
jgi:pyridoxal phosphate enzyme (YggS family)